MPFKTHTFKARFTKANNAMQFVEIYSSSPLGVESLARKTSNIDSTWECQVYWIDPRNSIARQVVDFNPSWKRTLVGERDANTMFN
jgi:hypothetical protein